MIFSTPLVYINKVQCAAKVRINGVSVVSYAPRVISRDAFLCQPVVRLF